jgi:hypothetical protein
MTPGGVSISACRPSTDRCESGPPSSRTPEAQAPSRCRRGPSATHSTGRTRSRGRFGSPARLQIPPSRLPHLENRLPEAVSAAELSATSGWRFAMYAEWNRVTPQLGGMSPLVSRTPPIAGSRSSTLGGQRRPIGATNLAVRTCICPSYRWYVPLSTPTETIGTNKTDSDNGFPHHK